VGVKYIEDAHEDEGDVANGDDYVFCTEGNGIVDPDPDDPYYFGPPGSRAGSINTRYMDPDSDLPIIMQK
jgi:hypothetical protein